MTKVKHRDEKPKDESLKTRPDLQKMESGRPQAHQRRPGQTPKKDQTKKQPRRLEKEWGK